MWLTYRDNNKEYDEEVIYIVELSLVKVSRTDSIISKHKYMGIKEKLH